MATQRDNDRSPVRVGSACCAVALSLMLAGQWPADAVAFAAEGNGAIEMEAMEGGSSRGGQAEDGAAGAASEAGAEGAADAGEGASAASEDAAIDVSADWTRIGLTLSHAGRYVLSTDVADAGTLCIAAPAGETIELDLCGHTVWFANSAVRGIDLSGSKGTVRIVDSQPRYKDACKDKTAENLASSLVMNVSDPEENVYGVYFAADERAVSDPTPRIDVEDVAVEVGVSVSNEKALSRDAVGVYVSSAASDAANGVDFSLAGSSVAVAVAAKDDAACETLSLGQDDQPETGLACAVFAGCTGVSLDGSMRLSATGFGDAVDLASSVEDAFSFGRDLVFSDEASANVKGNADGAVLGHIAEGFAAENLGKLAFSAVPIASSSQGETTPAVSFLYDGEKNIVARAKSEGDAAGSDAAAGEPSGPSASLDADARSDGEALLSHDPVLADAEKLSVEALGEGVFGRRSLASLVEVQEVGESRIVASLVRDGEVKGSYATVDDALSHMASGDTLRLESDVDNLVFAQAGNTLVDYSIDLAGHTVGSLTVSSLARVGISSSAAGGTIGAAGNGGSALTYSGGGKLSVEGVSIRSYSGATKACGIALTGSGSLNLTDVDIAVSAQGIEARGINQTSKSGGAVVIKGGSIEVSTSASGVAVYGITMAAQAKTLSLEDCPIAVHGSTTTVCAIDSKGVVSVKGTSSQAKVAVSATDASSWVWGIRAMSASSSIWLTNCAVEVSAQNVPEGAQSWCVTAGDETTQNAVKITLDGDCSFKSCTDTDIALYKTPLQLGESFNPSGAISLSTRGLADDVFAARTKASSAAEGFASAFSPVAGSAYEGWTAQMAPFSASKLAWHHDAVARNSSTGAEYASFAQALAQAKSGDEIELTSDTAVRGAVAVSQKNLAIDLGSHTLTVAAEGDASAGSGLTKGAFAFNGGGTLTVSDGSIAIEVGRDVETTTTASSPYQGFAVSGGGELVLSGCTATVRYTGQTTTDPQVALYGASNASGSFKLQDSSRLIVRAAERDGEFGASTVCGLYGAGSKNSDALSVDLSSSVTVENNAKALVQGQIAYPDGVLTGTNSSTNADLVELSVDPDSDLYAEIQQQFVRFAKFDSNLDENGGVYNTGVYYASSMELPSGLTVWAFSDPVSSENAGKLENVKASHFFVRSNYQVALDAYGVTSGKAYAGTIDVAGSVSATTTQGHAFGAFVPEKAGWSVPESCLDASATGGEYRARIGKFDLSRHIKLAQKPAQEIVFPKGASYREVARVKSQAAKVVRADQASEELIEGGVGYDDLFGSMNSLVRVTFSNIRTAQGASAPQTVSATRGKTLADAGASAPSPSDYTVDDVTYRFVGWRLSSAGSSTYAYDPTALAKGVLIDANLTGVADGSVEFAACYVPVRADEHLVKFRVEYGVYAMAVADGAAPTYAECAGLPAGAAPSRLTSVSSSQYTVTFKGWAADASGAYDYQQGETLYSSSVPAVRGDVTYSARFESAVATMSLGLYYLRQMTDGTYAYSLESVKNVDWTHDAIGLADERAKVGQTIVQNGVMYTLLGWSPRVSDKEPLYTDTLPLANDGDILSDRPTYYAIYRQAEKSYHVNFYVNGALYSEADDVTASTTLYNAWNASSNAVEPTSKVAGETFKGWNSDEKASTYFRASIKKVGEIAASSESDEVNLYAIWSTATDDEPKQDDEPKSDGGNPDDSTGGDENPGDNTGGGNDNGTGGGAVTGGSGVTLPTSGGAALPTSGAGGTSLAAALKSSGDADAADGGEDLGDLATSALAAGADAAALGTTANADDSLADDGADQDGEDSSNAAGVVGVIVAALAAIGAVAWWFLRRRAGAAEDDEDDLPAPEEGADAPKAAGEGIRF